MDTPIIPNDLLTPNEAAKLLATSPASIRRWVHAGTLPGFKVGGRIRVSRADVVACVLRVQAGKGLPTRAEIEARAKRTDEILREVGIR